MEDSHEELLAVTRYAEVLAHVTHFGPDQEAEVRRRLEVDDAVWQRSQAHWQLTLAADALSPRAEHAPAFARSFGETQKRLTEESPSLDEVGSPPEPAVENPPDLDGEAAASAGDALAPEPLASPPPIAPPPAPPPTPPPAAPAAPRKAPAASPSPWAASAETPSSAPSLGTDDAPTQGTAVIDPNALAAVLATTPFSGKAPLPTPAAPALDVDVDKGETGFIDPVAVARAATPFMNGASPPPGPATPAPADAPPAPAPPAAVPPAPDDSPDATAFVDLSALGTEDLPFADAPAVAPPSALTAEDQASFGETGMIDPAQFAHLAVPFDQGPQAGPETLGVLDDLQQYASYCVELVAYPGHEDTIRQRYGVTSPEHHGRVGATWSTRFGSDPALQQRFQQAVDTYRAWLASQKR